MFAKVALKGKISFGTCIQNRGQTSLLRPGLVLVEGAGTENLQWRRRAVFLAEESFPDLQSRPVSPQLWTNRPPEAAHYS